MEDILLQFIIIVIGGSFVCLLLAALAKRLIEYRRDVRCIKMEIARAEDEEDAAEWRFELTALRWSLLPGITPERAKRVKYFFSRKKESQNTDHLTSLLFPSLLGMLVCSLCLVSGTFAWFTASQTTGVPTIQAGRYTVNTTVLTAEQTPITGTNNRYALDAGTYTVVLTAQGDATTGYCVISVDGTEKTTQQVPQTMTFTLIIQESATVVITPQWGTAAAIDAVKIHHGDTWDLACSHHPHTVLHLLPTSHGRGVFRIGII